MVRPVTEVVADPTRGTSREFHGSPMPRDEDWSLGWAPLDNVVDQLQEELGFSPQTCRFLEDQHEGGAPQAATGRSKEAGRNGPEASTAEPEPFPFPAARFFPLCQLGGPSGLHHLSEGKGSGEKEAKTAFYKFCRKNLGQAASRWRHGTVGTHKRPTRSGGAGPVSRTNGPCSLGEGASLPLTRLAQDSRRKGGSWVRTEMLIRMPFLSVPIAANSFPASDQRRSRVRGNTAGTAPQPLNGRRKGVVFRGPPRGGLNLMTRVRATTAGCAAIQDPHSWTALVVQRPHPSRSVMARPRDEGHGRLHPAGLRGHLGSVLDPKHRQLEPVPPRPFAGRTVRG